MLDLYAKRIKRAVDKLDPWNYEHGMVWYYNARIEAQGLADKHGISLARAAAIIAVLSPGASWERNIIDAHAVCSEGNDAIVTTYGANKRKAVAILTSSMHEQYVKGNKVRSFYENILIPESSEAVTLDRHMLRLILRCDNDSKAMNRVFASSNNYQAIAEHIRRRARKLNIRPCQLQAALWLQVRPNN